MKYIIYFTKILTSTFISVKCFIAFSCLCTIHFNAGGSWPVNAILSSHIVHSEQECSVKCLDDLFCTDFNYNSRTTDKNVENCQLRQYTLENVEVTNGNGWIFYQILITVST